MNKSDLIEELALKMEMPVQDSASVTSTILDAMSKALTVGHAIEIRGFGSFKVRSYGSYMGRNPKSGEKIEVAPKKLPFFKVGKELRERINAGRAKKAGRAGRS